MDCEKSDPQVVASDDGNSKADSERAEEGKLRRGSGTRTEKRKLRERIREMLLRVGWTIDYRPRRSRDYLDAVYVNPSGTAYWSIIKAYDAALQNQLNEEEEVEAKRSAEGASFLPITDDELSQLTRKTRNNMKKNVQAPKPMKRSVCKDEDAPWCEKTPPNKIKQGLLRRGSGSGMEKQKLLERLREMLLTAGWTIDSRPRRNRVCLDTVYINPSGAAYWSMIKAYDALQKQLNEEKEIEAKRITDDLLSQLTRKTRNERNKKKKQRVDAEGDPDSMDMDSVVSYEEKLSSYFKQAQGGKAVKVQYMNSPRTKVMQEGWIRQEDIERIGFHSVQVDGDDPDDDTCCGLCRDGGDSYPSTFHQSCLNIQEVTVCQTCGDRGFEDALIYCNMCQNHAHHLYCLAVPAQDIFDEEITWLCEDCEPPKIVQPSAIDKSVRSPENLHNNKLKKRKLKKKSNILTFPRSAAKTKVRICEGPKMKGRMYEGDKTKVQNCEGSSSSEQEAECSNNSDNGQSLGNQCRQIVPVDQFNSSHDVAKLITTSEMIASDALKITDHSSYVAAQPIIDPIWRGSLSIFDKDFNSVSGLVAHLSSLACAKVCKEAELLPLLLFPDLVHRTDVWPKAFEKSGPSDQSIAFYLFPDNERDVKDFDSLVASMIHDDLAMKAVLDNAELLVFTSIILPEQYQRFQMKIYLWGVFREKKFPQLTNDNVAGGRGE